MDEHTIEIELQLHSGAEKKTGGEDVRLRERAFAACLLLCGLCVAFVNGWRMERRMRCKVAKRRRFDESAGGLSEN